MTVVYSEGSGIGINKTTKTISITSGKGGVGKSTIVANMALTLSRQGKRVLILDGDLGMANIDILFGVRTPFSIQDVLNGTKRLKDIIVDVDNGISLIPGGSGIYGLQDMNSYQKQMLMDEVNSLTDKYDYMLIDTAPGIADSVLYLNSAAQEIIVLVTPDPSSLTDSYALIKVLNQRYKETRFSIVCNMVKDEIEAKHIYRRISDVAERFLCVSLDYKGHIPLDVNLRNATKSQQLVVHSNPRSPSSFSIHGLSKKVSDYSRLTDSKGGLQFFWEQMIGVA